MDVEIKCEDVKSSGVKIIAYVDGEVAGRAYVYVMTNDLHSEPFAYLEDVFVEEPFRGKGVSKPLLDEVCNVAKKMGCYKIVCTSRFSNEFVHEYYQKLGYEKTGFSFRMNL